MVTGFEEAEPNNLDEIKALISAYGHEKGGEIIKGYALDGNVACQIFMSQLGLSISVERRTKEITRDIELFTGAAAQAGDPASQYNLAKLYINKVLGTSYHSDMDVTNIKRAKYWHGMAAEQGFEPAMQSLKNLECFDY